MKLAEDGASLARSVRVGGLSPSAFLETPGDRPASRGGINITINLNAPVDPMQGRMVGDQIAEQIVNRLSSAALAR